MTATYNVVEAEEDYTPSVAVTGDVDESDSDESTEAAGHNGASGTVDANDGTQFR